MTAQPVAQTSNEARVWFTVVTALGVPMSVIAWFWYGLAGYEEQSEQGKAEAAGTTMAGFADAVGGVPLVLAHVLGLITLVAFGWIAYRGRGIGYAIMTVALVSLLGMGIANLLWEGRLFEVGYD